MKTVAIGIQSFDKLREENYFYVDKTSFIKEWWESGDDVTLITRPRRFGKTLNMSMLECFFSTKYANRSDLFEDLSIWEDRPLIFNCDLIFSVFILCEICDDSIFYFFFGIPDIHGFISLYLLFPAPVL